MTKNDTVREINERLTIQDIVSPYVKLTKAGKSLKGVCPFHKEKTPSFFVSPERGTWHCFGCGLGGDSIAFVERIEGVDFKGALKILAEKAGVPLNYVRGKPPEEQDKRERLREAMNRACEWYASKMPESSTVAYASGRGLSSDTIRDWRLGSAPDAWRSLLEAMSAEGFTTEELLAAGLVKEADGKKGTFYDRFRNRLMFPIRDVAGRVVAFTGRALSADEQAKYLNSPETELYHKSEILFGMDRAKEAIRARRYTMLVEGQMDVLLAHQAGFENAVALSGTALTEMHLALMKRYSENLMLVLDADAAGLAATAKSAILALTAGMNVKVARLPSGKDPADCLSEDVTAGTKEFSTYITAAKPVVDFFLAALVERERDTHKLVAAVEATVLPIISAVKSPMEREHFAQHTARALGLSTETIREALAQLPKQRESSAFADIPKEGSGQATARSPRALREEQILGVLAVYAGTPLANRVEAGYRQITEVREVPRDILPESVLFQVEQTFGENPREDAADDLLRTFEELVVREAYNEAVAVLRRVESQGDDAAIREAQATCATISARLASIGS